MTIEKKETDENAGRIDSPDKNQELDPPEPSEGPIHESCVWDPSKYKSKKIARKIEKHRRIFIESDIS